MRIGGLSLLQIAVIAIIAVVAWHAWQRRQGVVRGPVHKPQPGAGVAA